ncbi:GmrSD restriction endonuclease domain-containing protein [Helicobacter pylori]|uniref:GmrSD restriction endonuclease domain-containing protein n=1 Tax=Helicobacter pylori TaxID=210 RepID=UPI003F8E20D0
MELLDLDGVIEKGVFEIPSYQRGYAWQERQLKDFWNDLELCPNWETNSTTCTA